MLLDLFPVNSQIYYLLIVQVNTASRMESTSEPNKIQVSQKTADLIIAFGKEHWLTARKDQNLS